MKTAGIICEYNPFHNGHKYHIEKTRDALNVECVVCVMSGNVVQRGEISIADMYERAELAIKNGADLVLEIPPRFVLRSAQYYAYYGAYILNALGNVDYLSFGSECGDLTVFEELLKKDYESNIKENLKSGKSYGACISDSEFLKSPNNILAFEYMKALKQLSSPIKPFTFSRFGAEHDSKIKTENTASASFIRQLIRQNKDYYDFVPYKDGFKKTFNENNTGLILSYKLKSANSNELCRYMNISEGLENRMVKFSDETNMEEFIKKVYCKRYITSRIRRAAYSIIFDIKKGDELPEYTRVLAFNEIGQKYLSEIKKTSQIKVFNKITKRDIYKYPQLQEELRINSIISKILCP